MQGTTLALPRSAYESWSNLITPSAKPSKSAVGLPQFPPLVSNSEAREFCKILLATPDYQKQVLIDDISQLEAVVGEDDDEGFIELCLTELRV